MTRSLLKNAKFSENRQISTSSSYLTSTHNVNAADFASFLLLLLAIC